MREKVQNRCVSVPLFLTASYFYCVSLELEMTERSEITTMEVVKV